MEILVSPLLTVSCYLFANLMCRRCPRHLDEDEREHRKYRRLNESDEDFQEEERQRNEIRDEVKHHGEEHLPRENIPEQPEGK